MKNIEEMIFPADLGEEIQQSFLDYSVSVITDRALPDVRDGMKPVHRRILYAMHLLKLHNSKPHRKSAQVVGEVLAKLHPHGDSSVYEAMVRLSQDFSLNHPLVDGHGNFGNIDGDPAAAYRYTEARLSKVGEEMLRDLDKGTVDWKPNFSEDLMEPEVLPARLPQLLINGTTGIAVGMACSFVPHNLSGVLNAIKAYMDNPEISTEKLLEISGGPDFPTGGLVINQDELLKGYETGRGKVRIRGKYVIEKKKGKDFIVFYEIPYMTKKTKIIEDMAKAVEDKEIEGVKDIRDESAKDIRLVVEVAKGYSPKTVAENIFAKTQLENTYSINNTCLVDGEPKTLSFKELIKHYVLFQQEVVTRRTEHDLEKLKKRRNIVEGLILALGDIDKVIKIIRGSESSKEASSKLVEIFEMNKLQAEAVLRMRLSTLTKLQIHELEKELKQLIKSQKELEEILSSESTLNKTIISELFSLGEDYKNPKNTELTQMDITPETRKEAIKHIEDVNISIDGDNIVSFVSDRQFKSRINRENSFYLISTNTGEHLKVFTSKGQVYRVAVDELQQGDSLTRVLDIPASEKIVGVMEDSNKKYLLFATKQGMLKKTLASEYSNIRRNGVIGIRLSENDEVVSIAPANNEEVVVLATDGQTIRFKTDSINPTGRNSMGVKAIKLNEDAQVVDFTVCEEGTQFLVTTSKQGMVKKTPLKDFPIQGRNGKGVIGMRLNSGDEAFGINAVSDDHTLVFFGRGRVVKSKVKDLSIYGRNSVGNIVVRDGELASINRA